MTKTMVITGAGRGIGRAIALACAANNQLVLLARSAAELQAVAIEIQSAGGTAQVVVGNASDPAIVQQAIDLAQQAGQGHIDGLILAAGVAHVAHVGALSLQQWQQSLDVNLTASFLACQAALPYLKAGSQIIAISSIAGKSGFPGWAAYSASKFGLMGFLQALREELRPQGVRVTAVVSAAVDTALWNDVAGSWNRQNMLQASEVANAVAHILSQPSHVLIDEISIGHVVGKL
ncbi:MAG TPA: KR domain-containing protein [Herpetosiphon sp.]|uniref:Short-chain dehydrogenase/reductase SDR n=1 Tax=Herpetosiphon aurantiacus (strain ATCC 23779 / DSM 785 / 114-95) TaxID=316274 RepID=A9B5F9_HERA2|nr:SDR family NAD(P)-dependent oxidoreductase [Herpetosiphon sp.]ABX02784.1 short-chain dehydrogenase/reductase SDR [Herpetosiphon aurantiacus DSM 785]HBW50597.1 KR domain-containing protein [Herpetosiphon sp.]